MAIKHKIKIRKVTGIGVHGLATGDSLDLSDDPKGERRSPASDGESARRSVPADDRNIFKDKTISDDYKSGGAYKAMLSLFADHVSDEEYAEHCRRFFKGNNENDT